MNSTSVIIVQGPSSFSNIVHEIKTIIRTICEKLQDDIEAHEKYGIAKEEKIKFDKDISEMWKIIYQLFQLENALKKSGMIKIDMRSLLHVLNKMRAAEKKNKTYFAKLVDYYTITQLCNESSLIVNGECPKDKIN